VSIEAFDTYEKIDIFGLATPATASIFQRRQKILPMYIQ
jgi:hypothetical protein